MIDKIESDHSKIKVGILKETPFLPVSDTVKRAMQMTKKALEDDGYQVVEFEITPEEFAFARNTLIAMVINGTVWDLCKDFNKHGERLIMGVWVNAFFLARSKFT
jgi:Asp-tRNA(Asn)/Glu-tRNA(Gln) amidotransferase A subunit family amidase